jgi:general secretion pathway protein N
LTGANLQLNADCCMQQAWGLRLKPAWNGLQLSLSDSQSQWPAQWLAGLGTPWNTIQAQGDLNLSTQGMTLAWSAGRLAVAGQAQLDALNMSSQLSTLNPMGSYRFNLIGGTTPTLQLATLQGSLQLSGSGQWVGGQLRFNGEASAVPEHQAALSNLLNIIGRRNGAHSIIKVG